MGRNLLSMPLNYWSVSEPKSWCKEAMHLVFIVLNVEDMVSEEENFVSMGNEISLLQSTDEATHRNVICRHSSSTIYMSLLVISMYKAFMKCSIHLFINCHPYCDLPLWFCKSTKEERFCVKSVQSSSWKDISIFSETQSHKVSPAIQDHIVLPATCHK